MALFFIYSFLLLHTIIYIIEDLLFCYTSIETITIPSTVEKIGESAFERCKNLETVTLNEGLKEIGAYAFMYSSIESITIPSTVKEIGNEAFSECSNLTRIDCKLKKNYVEANESSFEGLIQKKSIINWVNG